MDSLRSYKQTAGLSLTQRFPGLVKASTPYAMALLCLPLLAGCMDGRIYKNSPVCLFGRHHYGYFPCGNYTRYMAMIVCGGGSLALPDIEIRYDGEHYIRMGDIDLAFVEQQGQRIGRDKYDDLSPAVGAEQVCGCSAERPGDTYLYYLMGDYGFKFAGGGDLIEIVSRWDRLLQFKHDGTIYNRWDGASANELTHKEAVKIFGKPVKTFHYRRQEY